MRIKVQIKRLHKDAVIPFKANGAEGNARYDLVATSREIKQNEHGEWIVVYGLGFATAFSKDYEASILPRSSVFNKTLILANSEGIVDSSYRGEWKVVFKITSPAVTESGIYQIGDRIAQTTLRHVGVIEWVEENDLPESVRGDGGFGSTGR